MSLPSIPLPLSKTLLIPTMHRRLYSTSSHRMGRPCWSSSISLASMDKLHLSHTRVLLEKLDPKGIWSRWPARILVGVLAGSFFLFLGIPLASLLLREPPGVLWSSMQQPEVIQALQLSIVTTCTTTLLPVPFALPFALCLPRFGFPGRKSLTRSVR